MSRFMYCRDEQSTWLEQFLKLTANSFNTLFDKRKAFMFAHIHKLIFKT